MKYWQKVSLILALVEIGVLLCFQGIMDVSFNAGAAFNAGVIGFCLGFALYPTSNLKPTEETKP